MKYKLICFLFCALISGLATAGDATNTMASVLVGMNHFPSAADKEKLAVIVADENSTADDKQLAEIMSRIAHKANDDDRMALEVLLAREDVQQASRTIAQAILGMNHKPKSEDIAALKLIAG